jgi:hypothetical protein
MCCACRTNGEKRNAYWFLVGKPKRKRPLERPKIGGVTILRLILDSCEGVVFTGLVWLRIRISGELL